MSRPTSRPTLETVLDRRRRAGGPIRRLTDADAGARRTGDEGRRPFTSLSGWLTGILASVAAVGGILAAVVALPPLLDCRSRAEHGLYAGETFGACASDGIAARRRLLEDRVKRVVLRSGQ